MKSASAPDGNVFPFVGELIVARNVRAPQTTRPAAGIVRRQLMPSGFSSPFSSSVSGTLSCGTPTSVASRPAGAFQTPRLVSVRAMMPATAPHGTKLVHLVISQRIGCIRRGK